MFERLKDFWVLRKIYEIVKSSNNEKKINLSHETDFSKRFVILYKYNMRNKNIINKIIKT